MKIIKTTSTIIVLLIILLLVSYLALLYLEAPLIPSFAIVVALYAACILLPEFVRDIRILRLSAWLYSITLFIPLLFIMGPHTPAVEHALICVFAAGFCLYPIPVYILWVRKELDFWHRLIALTAMIIFAIVHICTFIMCFLFDGWHDLSI